MNPELTTMSPASLRPHPQQHVFYDDPPQHELQALADDLRQNGQRDPVHVMPPKNKASLPSYTILDGTRRCRAAVLAEMETVKVLVRHDLKDANAATVETEFLKFNFLRRQMRPLQKARVAMRLFLIETKRSRLFQHDAPEARDRVGRAIGMSGRNLDRYFRVLQTPLPVQNAVDAGILPLVLGSRVASLTQEAQMKLAGEIEGLRDKQLISRIVSEHLGIDSARRHSRASNALGAFAREIERGLRDLDGRLDIVGLPSIEEVAPILGEGAKMISHLLGRIGPRASGHDDRRRKGSSKSV